MRREKSFTLIELLIVVAIIAILAAIAVPNFLAAQIRGKYARAVSDLRSIATGLESYAVDHNHYPPNYKVNYWSIPFVLTTPIAYLTQGRLVDPFAYWNRRMGGEFPDSRSDDAELYSYHVVCDMSEYLALYGGPFEPPFEVVDDPSANEGALELYGHWKLISLGPDKKYEDESKSAAENLAERIFDIHYDPTNGAVSFGNIYRTQKSTEGHFRRNDI